jgi:hypothetical protein
MDKITPFFKAGITICRNRGLGGRGGYLGRNDRLWYRCIYYICNYSVGVGCRDY